MPSPRTSDTNGAGHHGDGGMDLRTAVAEIPLLPTPAVNDMGSAYTPETWDEWTATALVLALHVPRAPVRQVSSPRTRRGAAAQGVRNRRGGKKTLLPTPRATDGTKGGPNQRGSSGDLMLPSAVMLLPTPTAQDASASGGSTPSDVTLTDATVRTRMGTQPNQRLLPTPRAQESRSNSLGEAERKSPGLQSVDYHLAKWGEYEPAIRRWESVTRPAPEPTKLNAKGNPKLSDEFDEWLMGYPAGWITDVPGVTWNEALKACGNGVVPQQAAAALRFLLNASRAAA